MTALPQQVEMFLSRKFFCELERCEGMGVFSCLSRRGMFEGSRSPAMCADVRCEQGDEHEKHFRNILAEFKVGPDEVWGAMKARTVLPQPTPATKQPKPKQEESTMAKTKQVCGECGKGLRVDSRGFKEGLCTKCFKAKNKPAKPGRRKKKSETRLRVERAAKADAATQKSSSAELDAVVTITGALEPLSDECRGRVLLSSLVLLGNEGLLAS